MSRPSRRGARMSFDLAATMMLEARATGRTHLVLFVRRTPADAFAVLLMPREKFLARFGAHDLGELRAIPFDNYFHVVRWDENGITATMVELVHRKAGVA